MDHKTPAFEWLEFMARNGVKHEPDCPFMAWLEGQDTSRPVGELIADADDEIARQAILRIYEVQRPAGKFWLNLLRNKGASDAVIRWASK